MGGPHPGHGVKALQGAGAVKKSNSRDSQSLGHLEAKGTIKCFMFHLSNVIRDTEQITFQLLYRTLFGIANILRG